MVKAELHSIKNWERFEKLVAAIHHVSAAGAEVKWNEEIDGRQFDVVIRFELAAYTYLTVIECKDKARPVESEAVDALVTKANDVGANKAVMVSSSGFQKGATTVAIRHGVEIFTLKEIDDVDGLVVGQGFIPGLNYARMRFKTPSGGKAIVLPERNNMLPYLMNQSTIEAPDRSPISPHNLITSMQASILRGATDKYQTYEIPLPIKSKVKLKSELGTHDVSALLFDYRIIPFRILKNPIMDPNIIPQKLEYRDEVTGKTNTHSSYDLKLGFDTKIERGKFYTNTELGTVVYCINIENMMVTYQIVECYQHGMLMQARMTQDIKYSDQYVEITDKKEIARLRKMCKKIFKKHQCR